ncbi:hypothetical protein AVEN_107154-1 [Araneus ventricosus]|uniref:Uncharacterized protein n=1 Tax=Araneus ventricosus TaxID=182803 RepID=A0A4Y2CSP1_ARAVE|nr:hypothetical protein AVEN_107154-1 [Araneus ventricosus]
MEDLEKYCNNQTETGSLFKTSTQAKSPSVQKNLLGYDHNFQNSSRRKEADNSNKAQEAAMRKRPMKKKNAAHPKQISVTIEECISWRLTVGETKWQEAKPHRTLQFNQERNSEEQ